MSAREYNEKFARREGFASGLRGVHPLPSTDEFVDWAISFQRKHRLTADGYFGPSSFRKFKFIVSPAARSDVALVNGEESSLLLCGIPIVNWHNVADGFRCEGRWVDDRNPDEVVIHESVTASASSTIRAFSKGREYTTRNGERRTYKAGTHLMVDGFGHVWVMGDTNQTLNHVPGGHNAKSIGIEVVNPYEPKHQRAPWDTAIKASWAHGGEYVVPTAAQMAVFVQLVRWAMSKTGASVWHGVIDGKFAMRDLGEDDGFATKVSNKKRFAKPLPGLWAHQHIGGHTDGAFPLLVAYLCIRCEMPVREALAYAIKHASGRLRNVTLPSE